MTWEDLMYHISNMTPEQQRCNIVFRESDDGGCEWDVDCIDFVKPEELQADPSHYDDPTPPLVPVLGP